MDLIPTVYIVDDNNDHREILFQHVSNAGYKAKEYSSGEAFLEESIPEPVGCILLDNQMPSLTGLVVQRKLLTRECNLPIVFISGRSGIADAVEAVKNGALGFLEKPIPKNDLLEWVQRAVETSSSELELNTLRRQFRDRLDTLTLRERQVYDLVIRGNTNKMIAAKLEIKLGTVEFHRANLMKKMAAKSFSELMENAHAANFGRYDGYD